MPIPSPLHARTAPLCTSYRFKEWAGVLAVCSYDTLHDAEYFTLREAAGLLDVSPLFKVDLRGPDAGALLARLAVRDVSGLAVGRVAYLCWCDDEGWVVDDGTVARLAEDHWRLTAADPVAGWLERLASGFDVAIEDTSQTLAALAVQGPAARQVLGAASDAPVDRLRFFGAAACRVGDVDGWVTRTGFTGDLGYEIWVPAARAVAAWDALAAAGRPYGLAPVGLDALDLARVEAGFVLSGVDYTSARHTVVASRKSTPFELGFDWMVALDRPPFVGRDALRAAAARGPRRRLVGLALDCDALASLYDSYGLPAALPPRASRESVPVYAGRQQVGWASSQAFSPLLKQAVALAHVGAGWAGAGTRLAVEHTVEHERRRVAATVVPTPFFDPARKRTP